MAYGRLREQWAQTTALMSWVGRVGPWVDPSRINPYHVDPPKTPEQERAESRRAFAMLEVALRGIA